MIKILYIDHDLTRVVELTELLPREYNLENAFTGWEGLGAAMMYNPDIVLLNLRIVVMDGLELLRLIRTEEKLTNLPVLSFCDPSDKEIENLALTHYSSRTFDYPFEKEKLTDLIAKSLSHE